jgi:hypothetical protein
MTWLLYTTVFVRYFFTANGRCTNRPGHRLSGDIHPVMPGLDPGTRCISVSGYLSET